MRPPFTRAWMASSTPAICDGSSATYNLQTVGVRGAMDRPGTAAYRRFQEQVLTHDEDREICIRLQAGREALWRRGDNEVGPYQSPMEDGMVHFHEFLRRELAGR